MTSWLSKPTTDIPPGTSTPRSRRASYRPMATRSLWQHTPVAPVASTASAQAKPPSWSGRASRTSAGSNSTEASCRARR